MQNAIKRRLSHQLKQDLKETLFLSKNLLAESKVVLYQRKQNINQKNFRHSKHASTILGLWLNRFKLQFFISRLCKLVEVVFILVGNQLEVLL